MVAYPPRAAGKPQSLYANFAQVGGDLTLRKKSENMRNLIAILALWFAGGSSAAVFGIGGYSAPTWVDMDRDGDLDLAMGGERSIAYFRNTGTPTRPFYTSVPDAENPFATLSGEYLSLACHDLDSDGDADCVIGNDSGKVAVFVQQPTPPLFQANGLTLDLGARASPALADIDADGDEDIFVGMSSGEIRYFENTGSSSAPRFVMRIGAANPLANVRAEGGHARPMLVDVDHDGDFDTIMGSRNGQLAYFVNLGDAQTPRFADKASVPGAFADVLSGPHASPAAADVNNDGDIDWLVGQQDGGVWFFQRNAQGVLERRPLPGLQGAIKPVLADYGVMEEGLPQLNATQLQAMPHQAFTAFTAATLPKIPADAFTGLSAEQLRQLGWRALRGLTPEQFARIPKTALQGVTRENIGGFSLSVLNMFSVEDLRALPPDALATAKPMDISRIFTNLDGTKISPTDVRGLLPAGWTLQDNGELAVPPKTKLWFRELQKPTGLSAQITLPQHQPDFRTGFGLGGKTAGASMLDELNDGVARAGLAQYRVTQRADGVLEVTHSESAQVLFAFMPDVDEMTQQDAGSAAPGLSQETSGRLVLATAKHQRFPLIAAPKDPQALFTALGGGDLAIHIGTKGDVTLNFPAGAASRRTTQSSGRIHQTVIFDALVQDAPSGAEPGLLTQTSSAGETTLMVFADHTAQAVFPTVPQPEIFVELAQNFAGVESAQFNADGTFEVVAAGTRFHLSPTFDITSLALRAGETVTAALVLNAQGSVDYTVEHEGFALTTRVLITAL